MTNQSADEFNLAKSQMSRDFNKAITDAADQRKAAAEVPGDGFAASEAMLEESPGNALPGPAAATRSATAEAGESAAAVNAHLRHRPWLAIGVAAAAGLLIGLLASRR